MCTFYKVFFKHFMQIKLKFQTYPRNRLTNVQKIWTTLLSLQNVETFLLAQTPDNN